MGALPQARFVPSPLLFLALSISTGIFAGRYFTLQSSSFLTLLFAACGGLVILTILLVAKKKLSVAFVSIIAAFFCTGIVVALIEGRSIAASRISLIYNEGIINLGEPVELTGMVQGQPESAPGGFYLTLRAENIRVKGGERPANGTVLLLAHSGEQQLKDEYNAIELRHGARIRVMVALDREDNFRNPGVLRLTEYLERKGYDATGVIKSPLLIERLDDDQVLLPLAWLYEWRARLQNEFRARFRPETAGVLDAALLGNRYNISHSAAERLRNGGTFHVLVIAGLHISFVAGVLFFLARWLIRRRLLQFLSAGSLLWAYVIAIGFHELVARAALMFTLIGFAPLVWRRANSLNVIGGAALVLLVWRPGDLFDPSFQLTFLSVLAIVSLAVPPMRKIQQTGSCR